jgi:hypothetical protein
VLLFTQRREASDSNLPQAAPQCGMVSTLNESTKLADVRRSSPITLRCARRNDRAPHLTRSFLFFANRVRPARPSDQFPRYIGGGESPFACRQCMASCWQSHERISSDEIESNGTLHAVIVTAHQNAPLHPPQHRPLPRRATPFPVLGEVPPALRSALGLASLHFVPTPAPLLSYPPLAPKTACAALRQTSSPPSPTWTPDSFLCPKLVPTLS